MDELMYLRKRMVLPEQSTRILRDWLREHLAHPFPTKAEKQKLRDMTGMTKKQLKYWFTNARRRIVPRMKEEMQDTRSKASSAPDLMVSSSSSNETLGERGESLMARRKSVAMRRRRHISEDSSGTSPTSGKHYLDDDDDHIPAGLRRDSLSVPDLHSSCCSQLAALLERTPSGRIVSDRQPSIAASQPALAPGPRWPIRPAATQSSVTASSPTQTTTASAVSSMSSKGAPGSPEAAQASGPALVSIVPPQQPPIPMVATRLPQTPVAAAVGTPSQPTFVLIPGPSQRAGAMAYVPASPLDSGLSQPAHSPQQLQSQQPYSVPQQMPVVCLSPNQPFQVSVPISPSWPAQAVYLQRDMSTGAAAAAGPTNLVQPVQLSPDGVTPHVAPPLVQLPRGVVIQQENPLLMTARKP